MPGKSYSIFIGEAVAKANYRSRLARIVVEPIRDVWIGSPTNSSGSRSNYFYPERGWWRSRLEGFGLLKVFFGDDEFLDWTSPYGIKHKPLMPSYEGGAAPLTEDHLKEFKDARKRHKALHPSKKCKTDYDLRTLNYLVWWTKWSLKHCKHPTFYSRTTKEALDG